MGRSPGMTKMSSACLARRRLLRFERSRVPLMLLPRSFSPTPASLIIAHPCQWTRPCEGQAMRRRSLFIITAATPLTRSRTGLARHLHRRHMENVWYLRSRAGSAHSVNRCRLRCRGKWRWGLGNNCKLKSPTSTAPTADRRVSAREHACAARARPTMTGRHDRPGSQQKEGDNHGCLPHRSVDECMISRSYMYQGMGNLP